MPTKWLMKYLNLSRHATFTIFGTSFFGLLDYSIARLLEKWKQSILIIIYFPIVRCSIFPYICIYTMTFSTTVNGEFLLSALLLCICQFDHYWFCRTLNINFNIMKLQNSTNVLCSVFRWHHLNCCCCVIIIIILLCFLFFELSCSSKTEFAQS